MHRSEWIQNKIVTRDILAKRCNSWRTFGKKIVFTNGCFDILHRGHLDYLAKAADLGNILVVGVNSDDSVRRLKGENRPITKQDDRIFQLASLLVVDVVCLFEEDTPEELIKAVKPDVLVKGGDYTPDTVAGAGFVTGNGGRVEIIPFVEGYSTTGLVANIKKL